MIPKMPAPDLIRGEPLSEQITRKQKQNGSTTTRRISPQSPVAKRVMMTIMATCITPCTATMRT
jgi:hypothetical protein